MTTSHLTALCAGFFAVQDPEPASDVAKEIAEARDAYQRAFQDFNEELRTADTPEQRQEIFDKWGGRASAQHYTPRFLKVVREHPEDPDSLKALGWLLTHDRNGSDTAEAVRAVGPKLLASSHIVGLCRGLHHYPSTNTAILMRTILAVNESRDAQGYGRYALSRCLKQVAERNATSSGPEAAEAIVRELEDILDEITSEYADLKFNDKTLGEQAASELFEIRHLAIGKTAPEITGTGLDGKPMKLGDHRGKVVLLVWWATWCGPCVGEIPNQVELAERLKDKPFVILGVNGDEDPAKARDLVAEKGVNYRSWADGDAGPITSRWNVRSWPTLYLLDAEGVIRYKGVYLRSTTLRKKGDEWEPVRLVDEAVTQLLTELEDE